MTPVKVHVCTSRTSTVHRPGALPWVCFFSRGGTMCAFPWVDVRDYERDYVRDYVRDDEGDCVWDYVRDYVRDNVRDYVRDYVWQK